MILHYENDSYIQNALSSFLLFALQKNCKVQSKIVLRTWLFVWFRFYGILTFCDFVHTLDLKSEL